MASKKRITNVVVNAALITVMLIIGMMAFGISSHAASSDLEATGMINSYNGVFMRSRASTKAPVVTGLKDNTPVVIKGEVFVTFRQYKANKKWYYVSDGRYTGYIRSDLVNNIKYATKKAKTNAKVKYRIGGGNLMKKVGTIRKNRNVNVVLRVKIKGSDKVWYKIKVGSRYYYVSSTHVKLAGESTSWAKIDQVDPDDVVQSAAASKIACDSADWATMIANDNSFHYGNGLHSHHNGCYFCGTQPLSKQKHVVQWEKTYCCNPFVTAAYAHGGKEPFMLSLCQNCNSYMAPEFKKCPLFANLGHPDQEKLVKGDVLCASAHVAIYIGDGLIAEACTTDNGKPNTSSWNNSIRISTLTASRYNGFKAGVFRYIGETVPVPTDTPADPDAAAGSQQ